jgi:hypothetical protein
LIVTFCDRVKADGLAEGEEKGSGEPAGCVV